MDIARTAVMKAELAEEEAKAQWNTAKVLLRSDASAAAADIVSVRICSLHWDKLTSVRHPNHYNLSISHRVWLCFHRRRESVSGSATAPPPLP